MRSMLGLRAFARELRLAHRRVWRAPTFAVPVVLTLAVGLGLTTAMLGLMDTLWFRPPTGVAHAEHVVRVAFVAEDPGGGRGITPAANGPVLAALASSGAFAAVAGFTTAEVSLGRGVEALPVSAMLVTPAFFQVLGTTPARGTLDPPGAADGAPARAVLSYALWQRQFAADPTIVGRAVLVDDVPYLIAGVTPPGFTAARSEPLDLWLPMTHAAHVPGLPRAWAFDDGAAWLEVVARLRPDATSAAAEARASRTLAALASSWSGTAALTPDAVTLAPLTEQWRSHGPSEARLSRWLAGLSLLVLLMACVNVATLMVARLAARQAEYRVRLWLGATGAQVRATWIADVVVLAVPSTLGAFGLDLLARRVLPRVIPAAGALSPPVGDARTWAILGACLVLALGVSLVVTAWQLAALDWGAIRPPHTPARRWRAGLVALQSALCVALLFFAALFADSLRRVQQLDLGLALTQTLQVRFNLPRPALVVPPPAGATLPRGPAVAPLPDSGLPARATDAPRRDRALLYARARDAAVQLPGVVRAAVAEPHPYRAGRAVAPWTAAQSAQELWGTSEVPFITAVGAGFFGTVGARSLHGRDFAETDAAGGAPVVILNAPLARRLFPDRPPPAAVGACVWYTEHRPCARVVGVLEGVWKFDALARDRLVLFVPLAQVTDVGPGALLLQVRGDARAAMPAVRRALQSLRPDLRAVTVELAADLVERDVRPWRLGATLFGLFGAVAAALAGIGVYGLVAYTTRWRLRELGIRRALGAGPGALLGTVAREGVTAVTVGLAVGISGALVGSRWVGALLYETAPRDPWLLAATAIALLGVAGLAMVRPLWRALQTNPAIVLRQE
ncbi:MAG: ABC transporter permease [Gemmatimonadaceae bacterium]|nr:ABC transporter permease [Gemmatimonadaceae bacterium]